MKLENEFSVAASLEETWATLLEIERVAACLPGATIEPGGEDGVYQGSMKMKLGPMTINYQGTAKLQDVDEDTHTAAISVQAREAKGQGTAAAVISNHLERTNGKTRVVAVTDLKLTGRQAQFGRGIMEDVANSMMEQFAVRLEEEIRTGGPRKPISQEGTRGSVDSEASPPAAGPAQRPGKEADEDDVLHVGSILANTEMMRFVGIAAAVLLAVLAVISCRRQRHSFNINLKR